MCGPSGSSEQLAGSADSLASIANANYNQRFADQSALLGGLSNVLTPISQAGPSQQGFSAGQLATLNTQAIDSTGAAAKNAAQATQGALAGRGGSSGLQSGVDAQILAGQKSAAAGQLAGQQLGIQQANYQQGNQNWQQANAGLLALGQQYNPAAFGQQAQSANSNAFQEADQIQQEKNQEQADIAGGITSLAVDAATFGAGAAGGGGFAGGLSALKG
jgi:hypothetical protein